MLSRRSFLKITAGTIPLIPFLSGCSSQQAVLRVLLLQGSIPPQLLGAFRKQLSSENSLNFKPEAQLKDLFNLLQTWQDKEQAKKANSNWIPFISKKPPEIADLVTIGDYWLAQAIQKKLIQPLNIQQLSGWQKLSPLWQNVVKRNDQGEPDENGQIWGAPYRWGSTLIAYRQDKFKDFGWTPTDWSDLWREELRDRISLLDQPREVIGLTLKKLGYSYNSLDLTKIPNLKSELIQLQKQVKFYSCDRYLEPLILGDTWVAVGWSSDILSVQKRYSEIASVIPQSGTSLWTDLWVKPTFLKTRESKETQLSLAQQWINFCWQAQFASQISLFTNAISPILTSINPADLPQELQNNSLFLENSSIVNKSDFLNPLPKSTIKQYEELWQEIRTVLK